ncbi:NADH-quinone oxidoreductase subunit C [Streptomyces sp. NBC_00846]|uniref:NADH-quinone oxidoreductase subunit C n=1 Tax=Streptomyces sp. NBC_00846 TaxID=2975849 RepID=UPI0038694102|nr:NADH-quinone oxidoreductase subunit C [Streptomyces sp. NBC_00846]
MTSTPDAAAEGYDRLPDAAAEYFGEEATAAYAYDLLTVDVPAASWTAALETARDRLGCTYFDWLSAVDEPGTGFRVCAHVAALSEGRVRRLLIRTTVPHEAAVLPTAIDVYAGAAWHERETHEMFGIGFEGHPHLVPLLLPEGFEGHPLRKDFVLAARVAKAWPGAKEPGESEHGGPKRRTMLPPGVPDPNEWGPLKGQLPPAPSRPARAARAAGDRPVRRTRSASEGSAGQRQETAAPAAGAEGAETTPAAPPRRTRSASQGSASQQREATKPATEATKPATEATERATKPATEAAKPATGAGAGPTQPTSGSADAPWHHARPAFDTTPEPSSDPGTSQPQGTTEDNPDTPNRPATPPSPSAEPEQPEPEQPEPEAETPDRPAGGDTA